jgi:predicted transcriptional regulator
MKSPKYPNLVAEMARRGETQRTISKLLNLTNNSVHRKMTGKSEWTISEIEILCEYFNKDYDELFK